MPKDHIGQCLWLLDTVRSAGRITKRELDAQWAVSPNNTKGEKVYPLRSFHRHRQYIADHFGLFIVCDTVVDEYFVSCDKERHYGQVADQLCNILAFAYRLQDTPDVQRRVLMEPFEDGAGFLSPVLEAMHSKHALLVTFRQEENMLPMLLVPYFLKKRNHVWYLAAKQLDTEEEARVYDLRQVASVVVNKQRASMPRWFTPDAIFDEFFARQDEKEAKEARSAARKAKQEMAAAPEEAKAAPAAKAGAKPVKEKPQAAPELQLSLF